MRRNKIIEALENEQQKTEIPPFGPGDTVVVQVKVREGSRQNGCRLALLMTTAALSMTTARAADICSRCCSRCSAHHSNQRSEQRDPLDEWQLPLVEGEARRRP